LRDRRKRDRLQAGSRAVIVLAVIHTHHLVVVPQEKTAVGWPYRLRVELPDGRLSITAVLIVGT
jgi:hypothetical protein